ncbi:hypothetical protein I6M53_03135 [Shewanella algae]|uniref:hypothetical protein n=1 Tax=Shewanella algae TaxID=38313 RepID=UPI001AAC8A30|nr:hypothetical protein [Shewanella algae]MBO2673660.1 hypothetical protein [Shewanella algae]
MSGEPSKTATVEFSDFLESFPPLSSEIVNINLIKKRSGHNPISEVLEVFGPAIRLYCYNQNCDGIRTFRPFARDRPYIDPSDGEHDFTLNYKCNNCMGTVKTYSLRLFLDSVSNTRKCLKIGEYPAFGKPTPNKVLDLFGSDRSLFLKGVRCENQSLGIAAFTYYRRVVESQKSRILDKIIKVSEILNVDSNKLDVMRHAKKEGQFSKSIDMIKDYIPEQLFIKGHNPLKLLYSSLSEGVHALSDEDCLQIANDIRLILIEFSMRLEETLKEDKELNLALVRLSAART